MMKNGANDTYNTSTACDRINLLVPCNFAFILFLSFIARDSMLFRKV